jgi:hypothetical protein
MRWRKKQEGDVRVRTRFLIFPKTIYVWTRWWERATWKEQYTTTAMGARRYWKPIEWVD